MRKALGPVVGVSFADDQIRAIVARSGPSGTIEVTHVASAPLPPDTLDDRGVKDPVVLAAAVRLFLVRSGITARTAVIGLPSSVVFARTVTIPPVPATERRTVVRGEIDHLGVLPPGMGTFDYALLERAAGEETNSSGSIPLGNGVAPSKNGAVASSGMKGGSTAASTGDTVLFFAAEQHVVEGFRAVAAGAGLRVIGMEPADYAAVRSVYPDLADERLALAISLGTHQSHLQFFRRGRPVYARRLDVGIAEMVVPEMLLVTPGGSSSNGLEEMSAADPNLGVRLSGIGAAAPAAPRDTADSIADTLFSDKLGHANSARQWLTVEIGRSLEYFAREYASDLVGLRTVMLPNDLNLAGLPVYVTAALEQEVDFAYAFEHVRTPASIAPDLLQEQGVAFAPALGLALGPLGGRFAGLPVFDLSLEAAEAERDRRAPHLIARGAIAGVAALAAGVGVSLFLGHQDAPLQQELTNSRPVLTSLTQQANAERADLLQQKNMVQQIRAENLPWTDVLRSLSRAVPPGIGLTSVTAQGPGALSIAGETTDPDRIAVFWGAMSNSPFFTGANVTAISRTTDRITFQMTATLPPPTPEPAPNSAPAATGSSGS